MNSQDLKEKIDQVFNKYNHELVPLIFILTQKSEEMELAKIKAKTSLEKTQTVMRQLNQSGALKAVGDQLASFLINRFGNKPVETIKLKTEQEEIIELEKNLKTSPLKTMCDLLGSSLEDEQKANLKENLGDLFDDFEKLFNVSSEEEARNEFLKLRNKINTYHNPINLLKTLDCLEEKQKYVISRLMTFDLGEV